MQMSLPIPVGRQKEVVCLPTTGHFVVLGAAGCGKTTLAILRAAFLADRLTEHHGNTLLVTFNRTLVAYLKHFRHPNLGSVKIENYHTFARGYLSFRGKLGRYEILDSSRQKALILQAFSEVMSDFQEMSSMFAETPTDIIVDEVRWLSQHGISTLEEYQAIDQDGQKKARFELAYRDFIFSIYERYKGLRSSAGKKYDWDDIAGAVCDEMQADESVRHYKHIVIDEGQDFSPQMIKSLVSAIPADGTITFFGDMVQQIYGSRVSWRSAGLKNVSEWRFEENYRNSKQIAKLALEITRMPYYSGVPDIVEPKAPSADGPLPLLVELESKEKEIQFVVKQANILSKTQSVAILFRDREDEASFSKYLTNPSTRLHRDMTSWVVKPGIWYGTFHSAKGLEFDTVIIPSLGQDSMPKPEFVRAYGEDEANAFDGRLLYVGVTRAKSQLLLTYHGALTSLLPNAPLYSVRKL
jgi:superfamily I DNA/RNA helicase